MTHFCLTPARIAAMISLALLGACGDDGDGGTGPVQVIVATVEVTAPSTSLTSLGETVQLQATSKDASGNTVSGKSFAWTSSEVQVATVSDAGLATAMSNGSVTIRAMTDGVTGSLQLTVAQEVATVEVASAADTLRALGDKTRLTAEGKDALGNAVAATFTWASSDTSVATVDTSGVATAVGNGTTTISASSNEPPPVAPKASGNTVGGKSLPRTSLSAEIATIGHSALDDAADHGSARNRVTNAAVTGSTTITVAQAVVAILVTPASAILTSAGGTVQLSATAQDPNGIALDTQPAYTWASSNTGVATVSATGLATAVANGTTNVTATAGAVTTNTATNTAALTVARAADPATSTITAAPTTIQSAGDTTIFTITVQIKDSGGTILAGGGNTVALATTLGTLDSVTDNNNGTYTTTLTVGTAPGTATITGTLDGTAITDGAAVTLFTPVVWTWVSGSTTGDQPGRYGTQNGGGSPGARYGAASWIDASGNLWLFGGFGSVPIRFNDLWRGSLGN